MDTRYANEIANVTGLLREALVREEGDALLSDPSYLDGRVQELLRQVGRGTVEGVLAWGVARLTQVAKAGGLTVQRSPTIAVTTLFGPVEFRSPYLWDPRTKASARPVWDAWKLRDGSRTIAVERALTDFGAEESFGQASRRFQEHYGFEVGRTSVARVAERQARRAEAYVEQRLQAARATFEHPLSERPGVEYIVAQLDGCEIRTGQIVAIETEERTKKRNLPRRRRNEAWRDVRVGLARPANEVDATYVACMDKYPVVVHQIFDAACLRGLSTQTQVVAVADGGNGLREELDAQFANLRFVLDRPHLKQHLFETAEACGLVDQERERWVGRITACLDVGTVQPVLDELAAHKGRGKHRVTQLLAYLTRFRDAFGYDELKKAGLPIGSGEIESAHRTIPQKRLKLPGAWWHPRSVNPMLALRVLRANGWWDDFWRAAA